MSAASSPLHHCSSILFLPIQTKLWEADGAPPGRRTERTSASAAAGPLTPRWHRTPPPPPALTAAAAPRSAAGARPGGRHGSGWPERGEEEKEDSGRTAARPPASAALGLMGCN